MLNINKINKLPDIEKDFLEDFTIKMDELFRNHFRHIRNKDRKNKLIKLNGKK